MDNKRTLKKVIDAHIAAKCNRIVAIFKEKGYDANYIMTIFLGYKYVRFDILNLNTNKYVIHEVSYKLIIRFSPYSIVHFIINEYKWE